MDWPLTTTVVPSKFLKDAGLAGHIPHKALASDPRVSYMLHVPPTKYPSVYTEDGGQGSAVGKKLPLLVWVHGTRRTTSAMHGSLEDFAESTPCAVLAPLFPAGLDGPGDVDSYKVLKSATLRSDICLLSMLDEIAERWPGIETEKVFLMGFSGGGQFALRFLYLYPEKLAAISVGSPGRVTLLDYEKDWPAGIADAQALFERTINKDLIRKVPIQLIVGSDDNTVHGGPEFWKWAKEWKARNDDGGSEGAASGKAQKGLGLMARGRCDTLKDLHERLQADGIETQLQVIEGVGHEDAGVREDVLRFLRPFMGLLDVK